MAEICNKCGKSAVLDSAGNCFHCADVDGKKYNSKKMSISDIGLGFIYVVGVLINIIIEYKYIEVDLNFMFSEKIFFWCVVGASWFFVSKMVFLEIDQCWSTPIIALILSIVFIQITPIPLRAEAYKLRAKVNVVFPVIIGISGVVSNLFVIKNWPKYGLMNSVLDNEKKLTKKLSQIPRYQAGYTQEDYNRYFYVELDRAIQLVNELDIDDTDKQKTIQMLQSRGEIKSDVSGKLGYLSIINMLLEESFTTASKGRFVNEITKDRDDGVLPIVNSSSINGYVTEKYFDMYNRVEQEINRPYNYFLSRSYELQIDEWFKSFRNEYKTIKRGYEGEGRVAKALKKYEEQAIILPNIRIEVDGESSEMDYILISPYGVYSLEVKNLAEKGAYDILIEKDGRWNKVSNGVKKPMKSPDSQNERHIVHLETMINRALGRSLDDSIRVKGMIVIANDQVTIRNYNDDCVVKRYDYVMQSIRQNDVVLKESEMKQIAEVIKAAELEHIPYSFEFKGNYFDTYFAIKMLISEYMYWKQGNQELIDYVEEYRTKICDPMEKKSYIMNSV